MTLNPGIYRRRGQRGSACRVLIKRGISAAIAKGELEWLIGPLADFTFTETKDTTTPEAVTTASGCGWPECRDCGGDGSKGECLQEAVA